MSEPIRVIRRNMCLDPTEGHRCTGDICYTSGKIGCRSVSSLGYYKFS